MEKCGIIDIGECLKYPQVMIKPMPRTLHLSWKQQELPLLRREEELRKILCKNRSDLYKYALNQLYLNVKLKQEEYGKEVLVG